MNKKEPCLVADETLEAEMVSAFGEALIKTKIISAVEAMRIELLAGNVHPMTLAKMIHATHLQSVLVGDERNAVWGLLAMLRAGCRQQLDERADRKIAEEFEKRNEEK